MNNTYLYSICIAKSKITCIFLCYFLDPFACDGSMSEVYANVPMYIDWIMNKKRLHDTIGRDESNDVTTAEPLFFEIVLNIFLTSQIFQIY